MDISYFLSIEKKYDLYNLEQNGCKYWLYSRFGLWNYNICAQKLHLKDSKSEVNRNYLKIILNVISSIFSFVSLKKAEVLFLNHERRIRESNFFCCPYTEEISKKFSHAVLEIPFQDSHLKPVHTTNMVTTDFINAISSIYSKLYLKFSQKKTREIIKKIKNETENALVEICQGYNIELNKDEIYKSMAILSIRHKVESFFYDLIIKKVDPKVIVEVVYYKKHCMIINEISKKRRIPTVELQHGTIYENHAAYNFYKSCGKIDQLPAYVYLFSDFWRTKLSLPIENNKILSVGYPLFETELRKYNFNHRRNDVKTILFISQGTIGEMLSHLAFDLSNVLSRSKYRILYKLHPSEYADWKIRYPYLIDSEVEVLDKRESIYKYFAESDYQVGVYSTAIYEGIGFGLDTFIYKVGHYEIMESLVSFNYATFFSKVSELKELVERKKNVMPRTKLWKENALLNMEQEISKLID